MNRLIVIVSVVLLTGHQVAFAQARVDRNVVYGMYSGLALLMDVYRPAQPNGYCDCRDPRQRVVFADAI